MMHVVWAPESAPASFERSIFLAGPTPRDDRTQSWRRGAIAYLERINWGGVVFAPEPADGRWSADYSEQIAWEERHLQMADCIVFWVPRELTSMPGFTTNIEWGAWCASRKVVLGAPPEAPKMRYMRAWADALGVPQAETLERTLDRAIERVADGAWRAGGEREVPLAIWRHPAFERWYKAQRAAGHRLDGARVEYRAFGGPNRSELFAVALRPRVWIPSEGRHKSSEVILVRADTCSVVAWWRGADWRSSRVALVREFRSAATTPDGFVWELPGGALDARDSPARSAARELAEETGIEIALERLSAAGSRQTAATLLTHRAHLWSVELSSEEISAMEARCGEVRGSDDSERCTLAVARVGDLVADARLDWTNLGMILRVVRAGALH